MNVKLKRTFLLCPGIEGEPGIRPAVSTLGLGDQHEPNCCLRELCWHRSEMQLFWGTLGMPVLCHTLVWTVESSATLESSRGQRPQHAGRPPHGVVRAKPRTVQEAAVTLRRGGQMGQLALL